MLLIQFPKITIIIIYNSPRLFKSAKIWNSKFFSPYATSCPTIDPNTGQFPPQKSKKEGMEEEE